MNATFAGDQLPRESSTAVKRLACRLSISISTQPSKSMLSEAAKRPQPILGANGRPMYRLSCRCAQNVREGLSRVDQRRSVRTL